MTRSEMPWTAWRRTSSATRKASTIEVRRSRMVSSRSFGTTIIVSTSLPSAAMPSSAWAARRAPSKAKGLVTAATVSAPMSRASLATTGRGARAGAAAGAGGQEDHVGALEQLLDLVLLIEGRLVADPRIGSGAEAAGHLAADVQGHIRVRVLQRLKVGVDREELHARQLRLDHAVDGVDAGAADAHHPQDGLVRARDDRLAGRSGRVGLVAAVCAAGSRGRDRPSGAPGPRGRSRPARSSPRRPARAASAPGPARGRAVAPGRDRASARGPARAWARERARGPESPEPAPRRRPRPELRHWSWP